MRKVIHLLPYDGIGGAESAARSMLGVEAPFMDFQVRYIFKTASANQRRATYNPLPMLAEAWHIARESPELLIVSLWRSAAVGILAKMLRPRTKLVFVLHNSVDAHLLDFVFTRCAIALSTVVWADSSASIQMRLGNRASGKCVVIPFQTRRLPPANDAPKRPLPTFAFWGRLAPQKNLPRAIALFQTVWSHDPQARFLVIGPDNGEQTALEDLCARIGMRGAVEFAGPMEFSAIRERVRGSSFYLQTSDYEGMAMSVVEAMQLGLVPVVTAVGEIRNYCARGHNAVIVQDTGTAAQEVLALINEERKFQELRLNAIRTWEKTPLYREAVVAECARLMLGS